MPQDDLFLVLDLGDPLRFHYMLRAFKPSSPMSLRTWCLTTFSLPLTVAAALSPLPAGWMPLEWLRRLAVVMGLLLALGSAVYKGVLLSTNAQPGWEDARWLGALAIGRAERGAYRPRKSPSRSWWPSRWLWPSIMLCTPKKPSPCNSS